MPSFMTPNKMVCEGDLVTFSDGSTKIWWNGQFVSQEEFGIPGRPKHIVRMSGPDLDALRVKVLEGLAAYKPILLNDDETVEFVEAKLVDTKAMAQELAEQLEGQEVSIKDAEADEMQGQRPTHTIVDEARYFEPYIGEVPQPEDSEHDPVNHPKHYNSHPSNVECIEITRHMGFNLGNVFKYIWRDGLKDTQAPLEDLYKARWYLEDEIAMREERGE